MPLTFPVPLAAQRTARRALLVHRRHPDLDDVSGVSIAEHLTSGEIDADTVGKMYRFFRNTERQYLSALGLLRTERTDATVRSWALHGAEAGKVFAQTQYPKLVADGHLDADPLTALFDATPAQVYARFQAGAWRWEYGLNPRTAAAFVQHYTEATGQHLELPKAFGESAAAVGNQIWRRYHGESPFQTLRRALKIDDWSLQQAARADLALYQQDLSHLTEATLPWKKLQATHAKAAAQASWPTWLAYIILAVEAPKLLVSLNKSSKIPPTSKPKVKHFSQYHDAINVWLMYFHPTGARYHEPKKGKDPKKYDDLLPDLATMMARAYRGKKINAQRVKKLMRVARDWVHRNKTKGQTFAGTFHILINYWKKGAWEEILKAIPPDADVRPAFEQFAKQNPMPEGGVELTQKLATNAPDYKEVEAEAKASKQKVISLAKAASVAAAKAVGTPMGVKSVIEFNGKKYTVLSALEDKGGIDIVLRGPDGTLQHWGDKSLAKDIKSGSAVVVQAHADISGTVYGPTTAATPEPVPPPPEPMTPTPQVPKIDPKLSGTSKAIEYVFHIGGKPAVQADSKAFKFALGAQFQMKSDPSKTVAIAGYAISKIHKPLYVLRNKKHHFQAVSPTQLHTWYPDGPTGYDDDIVSALVPVPDTAVAVDKELAAYIDTQLSEAPYDLVTPAGTAFAAAAQQRGYEVKFGDVWVLDEVVPYKLAAVVQPSDDHPQAEIIFRNLNSDTYVMWADGFAAQQVTAGKLVPQGVTPEPSTTDAHEPVPPSNALGTPAALDFAAELGVTPVTQSFDPSALKFELGKLYKSTLDYAEYAAVIGYARDEQEPQYIIRRFNKETGGSEIELLPPGEVHDEFTGPIGTSSEVLTQLVKAAGLPKLPPNIAGTVQVQDFFKAKGLTALAQTGNVALFKFKIGDIVKRGGLVATVHGYATMPDGTFQYVVVSEGAETPTLEEPAGLNTGMVIGFDTEATAEGFFTPGDPQGTVASPAQSDTKVPSTPLDAPPMPTQPIEVFQFEFPNDWQHFKPVKSWGGTAFAKRLKKLFGVKLSPGFKFKFLPKGWVFEVLAAYRTTAEVTQHYVDPETAMAETDVYGPGTAFVLRNPDDELMWWDSGALAELLSDGKIAPAAAQDPEIVAQQTAASAAKPDVAAKKLQPALPPHQQAVVDHLTSMGVSEKYVFVDFADTQSSKAAEAYHWALQTGAVWVFASDGGEMEALAAIQFVESAHIQVYFKTAPGQVSGFGDPQMATWIQQKKFVPASYQPKITDTTTLPTQKATEAEKDALAPLPAAVVQVLIDEYFDDTDAEDVQTLQEPLDHTQWAKAAKTKKWDLTKGSKWVWQEIAPEEEMTEPSHLTVHGAIDTDNGYVIVVEDNGEVTAYEDAVMRSATLTDQLYPADLVAPFEADTQKFLQKTGAANLPQVPLIHTLFGISAGYHQFQEFVTPGATWQVQGGPPLELVGAVQATNMLLIVKDPSGTPLFKNDSAWSDFVEQGLLKPVAGATDQPLAFEQDIIDYITGVYGVEPWEIKKIGLDSTSIAVSAKQAGADFTSDSVWKYVDMSQPVTIVSGFALPGEPAYVLYASPDGTYASASATALDKEFHAHTFMPYDAVHTTNIFADDVTEWIAANLTIQAADLPNRTVTLKYTQTHTAATNKGWPLATGSEWVWTNDGIQIEILGAVLSGATTMLIVRRLPNGSLHSVKDPSIAEDIGNGILVPGEQYKPPQFAVGQVLTAQALPPAKVLAFDDAAYVLVSLNVNGEDQTPFTVSQASLEANWTLLTDAVTPGTFMETAAVAAPYTSIATLPAAWPNPGAPVQIGSTKGVLVGGVSKGADEFAVVLATRTHNFGGAVVSYDHVLLVSGKLFAPIATSYQPMEYPPDTPVEFAGIAEGFKWAQGQGYTLANKSESPDFKFHLGEIRASKDGSLRVVVGYAVANGEPNYILATNVELTDFTQKVAKRGNDQYGPPTGLHPEVRNNMLPKPGSEAPEIPEVPTPAVKTVEMKSPLAQGAVDLSAFFSPGDVPPKPKPTPTPPSYPVSDHATLFQAAMEPLEPHTFTEPPSEAKYHTYTTSGDDTLSLRLSTGTVRQVRVLGWALTENGEYRCIVTAPDVADPAEDPRHGTYSLSVSAANEKLFATTEAQVLGDDEGGATLSNNFLSYAPVAWEIDGKQVLEETAEAWDLPAPIQQGPIQPQPGKDISAGCVTVLPPGTKITGGGKSYTSEWPMVMLVHPRNKFGGPLAYPKGRVDKGEGLTRAAVREVWEETGVKIKPVAVLRNVKKGKGAKTTAQNVDWTGTTTVTRYYIGYVIGGHPQKYGWEADSITFKPLTPDTTKTRWFKKLSTRDREVTKAVIAWLTEHGLPQEYRGDLAPFDVQVTAPGDASGEALASTTTDPWIPLVQRAPFPITDAMLTPLRNLAEQYGPPVAIAAGVSGGPSAPVVGDRGQIDGKTATCLGYVGFEVADGSPIRAALFRFADGTVETRGAATLDVAWTPDPASTELNKTAHETPWFWHPDAETFAIVQRVYSNGGGLDDFGIGLNTFKKWMQEAGVPFWEGIEARDVGRVAALFVQGTTSLDTRNDLLLHLRKKAQLAGVDVGGPITTPDGAAVGATTGTAEPAVVAVDLPYFADANKELVAAASVEDFETAVATTDWSLKGGLTTKDGGSKPIYEVTGPDGKTWVYKPHEETQRPVSERAAFLISELLKPNNNPVGLVKLVDGPHGGLGSVQPKIDGKPLSVGSIDTLSEQDVAEIAAQHVVDMFLGDHDANPGNWMQVKNADGTPGPLVAIDKGQSFKFAVAKVTGKKVAGKDPTESLDPFDKTWKQAPGNYGDHLAKKLLRTWLRDDGVIPPIALRAMVETLDKLTKLTDSQITDLLDPVARANKLTKAQRKALIAEYTRRRDAQRDEWRDLFRTHLNDPTWDWPDPTTGAVSTPTPAPSKSILDRTPQEMGLTETDDAYVAEAAALGWAGKSVAVDRDAIEAQNVVVKQATTPSGAAYTILHWRVPKHAGVRAAKKLYPLANVVETATNTGKSGPKRSKIDDHFRFSYRIRLAADNLDFAFTSGFAEGGTPPVSEMLYNAAQAVRPELDKLDAATQHSGWYGVGAGDEAFQEPNPVVQDMVKMYRAQLDALESYYQGAETSSAPLQSGAILNEFPPFTWIDDGSYELPETGATAAPLFDVEYVTDKATWPRLSSKTDGTLTLDEHDSAAAWSKNMPQFVITKGSLEVHFNPPYADWRADVGASGSNVKNVKAWEGVCWAQLPGTPTTAQVAAVMSLWEAATKIEMRKPDPRDAEVLYFMQQAQNAQTIRAREVFQPSEGPTFTPSFSVQKSNKAPHHSSHWGGGLSPENQVQVRIRHKKGAVTHLESGKGFTVSVSGYGGGQPTVTVSAKLKPTDTVEILRVQDIAPNTAFEAIDAPELISLWSQYQDTDQVPESERDAHYAELLKGLKQFTAERLGMSVTELDAQKQVAGQYQKRPIEMSFAASDLHDDGTRFTGQLAAPSGMHIEPGSVTWTVVIGTTTVYVGDDGVGELDARSVAPSGKVDAESMTGGSVDYDTGAFEIRFPVAMKSDPAPRVQFFVEGEPTDGKLIGAGARRFTRVGWDRDRLNAAMRGKGKVPVFVAHSVTVGGMSSMLDFFKQASKQGAVLANYLRPVYGLGISGTSASADLSSGATGTFSAIRKGVGGRHTLYFDTSLLLRTDVYAVSAGDGFGAVGAEVYRSPEAWLAAGLHKRTGTVGSSSSYQVLIRDAAEFREYLGFATVASQSEAQQIIKLCYDRGWTTFWGGRRPEQVFVTPDVAQSMYGDFA